MATGWAHEGAVLDQINDTITDGVQNARARLPQGAGSIECIDCGDEIPKRRRQALPGVTTCVACQSAATTASSTRRSTVAAAKTASSSRHALSEPLPRVRVIDLETAGNGPHEVCEIGWQDVERGSDGVWHLGDERGSRLVNPGRPITPETMAVHHILDDQVRGAPYWKTVAPDILRPAGGVLALAAHRAAFEQRFCRPSLTGGAGWICTWKGALRLWPHLSSFSNQMLRYVRRPQGLVHELGLPAHRALPDAYVTAHHLRDMLNEVSVDQLLAWGREPGLLPRVPAGSERGKAFGDLSREALQLLAKERDPDVRFSAETELRRRGAIDPPAEPDHIQQVLL